MTAIDNAYEFSVSELSSALKQSIEDQFGNVRLRGEISGLKVPASGHAYLALKDDKAVIDGVMWKGTRARLNFRPEDGMEVIARGKLTTYPGRSKYQIIIDSMELAGEGALMALLEKRKRVLAAEGLFDAARKRPIPYLPETIGVVTSPTGAVIRDILHRLSDRFPRRVLVWPVKVQGEGAAAEVAAAIAGFNAMTKRPDVLIVARGGGSIEDLWAFNEEVVVRAVAASEIPVISAVGHETDTTLVDFAADMRAPTPTAAAELAVPVRGDLVATTASLGARLDTALAKAAATRKERLSLWAARLPSPSAILGLRTQRFDEMSERLPKALNAALQIWRQRFERAAEPLRSAGRGRLSVAQQALTGPGSRLRAHLLLNAHQKAERKLGLSARLLESLNPEGVLKRGYAIVEGDSGVLTSAATARKSRALTIRFADGAIGAVPAGGAPAKSRKSPKASGDEGPKQAKLL